MSSKGKLKTPPALVCVAECTPVRLLTISTVAPATRLPDGSVTVPVIVPLFAWPKTRNGKRSTVRNNTEDLLMIFIAAFPPDSNARLQSHYLDEDGLALSSALSPSALPASYP